MYVLEEFITLRTIEGLKPRFSRIYSFTKDTHIEDKTKRSLLFLRNFVKIGWAKTLTRPVRHPRVIFMVWTTELSVKLNKTDNIYV